MAIGTNRIEDDEMDMAEFFGVLWKRKWLVILGTAAVTVLAIAIVLLLPRTYRADGFLQLSGATEKFGVPEYKGYVTAFSNVQRFIGFAESKGYLDARELKKLKKRMKEPKDLIRWFDPVYAFTRDDTRELGRISKDDTNYLVGLKVFYESFSPSSSAHYVTAIGDFIKDVILLNRITAYIVSNHDQAAEELLKNENSIYSENFGMSQLENKKDVIKAMLKEYPESARGEIRQVISVENTGYRYLSPTAQLVGIESNIADIREKITGYQRKKEKASLKLEIFLQMKETILRCRFGDQGLGEVSRMREEFFRKHGLTSELNKEVFNDITLDMVALRNIFSEVIVFAGTPQIPKGPVGPKRKVIVAVSCVVSFFFFFLGVFVADWWDKNRKRVLGRE